MIKVLNTKVVPNIKFNIHANFHNFLRPLSIFPRFIFTPVYLEISVEKKKHFSFLGRIPRDSPTCEQNQPASPLPPRHYSWALAPLWPNQSETVVSARAHLSGFPSPKSPSPTLRVPAPASKSVTATPCSVAWRLPPLLLQLPPHLCALQHRPVLSRTETSPHSTMPATYHHGCCTTPMPGAEGSKTSRAALLLRLRHLALSPSHPPRTV
jgi:hypothetical protein